MKKRIFITSSDESRAIHPTAFSNILTHTKITKAWLGAYYFTPIRWNKNGDDSTGSGKELAERLLTIQIFDLFIRAQKSVRNTPEYAQKKIEKLLPDQTSHHTRWRGYDVGHVRIFTNELACYYAGKIRNWEKIEVRSSEACFKDQDFLLEELRSFVPGLRC